MIHAQSCQSLSSRQSPGRSTPLDPFSSSTSTRVDASPLVLQGSMGLSHYSIQRSEANNRISLVTTCCPLMSLAPTPLNTLNNSSRAYSNIFGCEPLMLQCGCIEFWDILRCKAPKLLCILGKQHIEPVTENCPKPVGRNQIIRPHMHLHLKSNASCGCACMHSTCPNGLATLWVLTRSTWSRSIR